MRLVNEVTVFGNDFLIIGGTDGGEFVGAQYLI